MDSDGSIVERIRVVFSEQLFELDDSVPEDADLFEEGLDSMALMQLILLLEQEFGISLGVADLSKESFKSLSTIATLVELKLDSEA